MIVYRLCNSKYADDLTGAGSKLYGGRWNNKGTPMLYVTQYISLGVLEMLVHTQFKDFGVELSLLYINIPDSIEIAEIKLAKLKPSWIEDNGYTKYIGNEFIKSQNNVIIKVPSAVINEEHNFLVNPLHADFKKIKIVKVTNFTTDKRLFSI